MNRERTFEIAATTADPGVASSADLDRHWVRARKLRAEVTAAAFAAALRRIDRSIRALAAGLARWRRQRHARATLMSCSDRVLADIGIAREDIPLVAKGIDPAGYRQQEPAIRRGWAAARTRLAALRQARRERHRLYRELDAYSDRELEEIGLRRADIPVVARGQPPLRRAA